MPDLTQHKATPECPMTAPHDWASCGIVRARHRCSASMNEKIEQQIRDERERELQHGGEHAGG
ncbi:MAG TPA: hypothetical protein VFW66_13230 [Gemmatimonadales bacterium]|nr:hypothetical protein [Gemmatimonadales bacterium]